MRHTTRQFVRIALSAALVAEAIALPCAMRAFAQDPFAAPGAAAPKAAGPKAGGPADPFGKAAASEAKLDDLDAAALKAEPLVIRQFRESNPSTPDAIVQAARAVLQYGRPDEAKFYLARLLGLKPNEAVLGELESQFGPATFLKFAQEPQVQPEGKQVADLVLAAAEKLARDPARIAAAIKQLSDTDPRAQGFALATLREAGPAVVTPLLRALADAGRESEHKTIRAALVAMAPITEAPLLGALETPNDYLRPQVMAILGRMESRAAVKFLLRPAIVATTPELEHKLARAALERILGQTPTEYEAVKFLFDQANRLVTETPPYDTDADGRTVVWSWDAEQNTTVPHTLPAGDAAIALAARLAADLHVIAPHNGEVTRLWLLRNLEATQIRTGLDRPLDPADAIFAAAKAVGPPVMSEVLEQALQANRVPAIIAAAQVLGALGDVQVLAAPALRESPLAQALLYPDARVRLQAAAAIVQLNPRESFPGASHVAETLGWLAATTGTNRVLIGHPNGEGAQTLVGFMNELGFDGDAAYTGRMLLEQAMTNPDFELVLISDAIDMPRAQELVQLLRKDYRTARLPIGIMARSEHLENLRDLFTADPLTLVVPRIFSSEVADRDVKLLLARSGRNQTSRDERLDMAVRALDLLATIAATPELFALYGVQRVEAKVLAAFGTPSISAQAAEVLALLGTAQSQTALVDFASQRASPIEARQAAAKAFAQAVQRRGIMLSTAQISAQYDRYNASEMADAATQAVLGSMLDAIEARAAAFTPSPFGSGPG
jgi:hypothetical protein